jgi:hypothetical protein
MNKARLLLALVLLAVLPVAVAGSVPQATTQSGPSTLIPGPPCFGC